MKICKHAMVAVMSVECTKRDDVEVHDCNGLGEVTQTGNLLYEYTSICDKCEIVELVPLSVVEEVLFQQLEYMMKKSRIVEIIKEIKEKEGL